MDNILAMHVSYSLNHLIGEVLDSCTLNNGEFTVKVFYSRISSRFLSTYSQTKYIFPFLKYETETEIENKWKLLTF